MKKLMTVLVAALFALSMTSAVFAEDKPAASPAPEKKAEKKDEKKKDEKKEEKKEEKK